jgi:N-acetylglucosaminyl-diphospho-decaprenol L-rhamnosyltransferase
MGRPCAYIPNLNGGTLLEETLRSLFEGGAAVDLVVVDNGSSDGSPERVRRDFPDADLIELGSNHGFGPSLNLAVRERPADRLIFLNNDIRCESGFLHALVEEGGPGTTVAGVLLQGPDPGRIDSAGVVLDASVMAFDYLHGEPAAAAEAARAPHGPTGGAALVELDAFNSVGGFDERIFAYYEDADLALRLRRAGVACRLAPGARAVHQYSSTLGAATSRKYQLTGWSRGYMLRRYGILRRPRLALHVLACEGAICAGQLVADRTAAGIVGRLRGWRAARGLEQRDLETEGLMAPSVRDALRRRRQRRGLGR